MKNDTPPQGIVPGAWVLKEKLTRGRFGFAHQVSRVVGQRVYYIVKAKGEPDVEKFCAITSVLHVVPSEEAGVAAWNEQKRLHAILEAEEAAAFNRFRTGLAEFMKTLKAPS